jgi:hypothetical protein
MLSRLAVYARNKHLIVNTSKSEVVHFNSAGENVPVFDVGDATLHQFHVPSSFFFWCLVQSGLFLFLKLPFFCYSSTALAGGYSCVTLTPYPLHHKDSFRYLAGMVFYRTLNMAKSADYAARPFLASFSEGHVRCEAVYH